MYSFGLCLVKPGQTKKKRKERMAIQFVTIAWVNLFLASDSITHNLNWRGFSDHSCFDMKSVIIIIIIA